MDVTPTNEVERGFTIGVVVFALVGFAYVVGSITASLAQLRTMSEEASKDFWQMRRFLNQNSVDHNLAARIQRFVEYAYSRQQKTIESQSGMYFVSFGRLEYIRMIDNSGHEYKEFVDKGEDWLAEPALWTEAWYHVGEAKAYTDCEVLLVDPKAFEEILNVVRPVASIVAQYCRRFMAWLQTLESEEGMLTDVIQGDLVSKTIQSFLPMWMVEKQDDSIGKLESSGDLLSGRWNLRARLTQTMRHISQ
eukprot:g24153.t1